MGGDAPNIILWIKSILLSKSTAMVGEGERKKHEGKKFCLVFNILDT